MLNKHLPLFLVLLCSNLPTIPVYAQIPPFNSQIPYRLPPQEVVPPRGLTQPRPSEILPPKNSLPTPTTPKGQLNLENGYICPKSHSPTQGTSQLSYPPQEQVRRELPKSIYVTEVQFENYSVLKLAIAPQELEELNKTYQGREWPLSKLLGIADRIGESFENKGYKTSGAIVYIPTDTQVKGKGPVIIKAIAGEIEETRILPYDLQPNQSGKSNFSQRKHLRIDPNYICSRLAIATHKPLNIYRLEEALQLLRINAIGNNEPIISNISAQLSVGSAPGKTILEVKVQEANNFHIPLSIDNNRSPSAGSFQRQIGLIHANLLGIGDSLVTHYNNTDGSNGWDLSYTLPINPYNGTFNFSYINSSTNVIEPPFEPLNISSYSHTYEFTLRQPVMQSISHIESNSNQIYKELALGVTFSRKDNQTYLLGMPYPLSPGANPQGRTNISALRFFQEWKQENFHEVIAVKSQFNFGIGAFDVTLNQPIPNVNEVVPDNRFFYWQGQAQWADIIAPQTLLLVRSNVQIAGRSLLPLEQFANGGFGSVRGYRQDSILSDNGFFASTELQLPILRISKSLLQVAPFVDYGTTWNSSGKSDSHPNSLASVGLGLQFRQSEHLTARLDWGIPLIYIASKDRTWQENGLTFSVIWNPF